MKSKYPWILVALLWVVALLNYLDRQIIFSVLPLVKADLKMSDVELGLLGAVFIWVYGILSPVAGYLGDRFGRVRIITVSLLVWSAVTWATGLARTPAELLWARGLMGISEACYIPAALALISDFHGDRSRSLATGLHFSGVYVGMVVGGVGGGWMGEQYGWRAAFTFLGIAGIAYTLVLRFGLREGKAVAAGGAPFFSSLRELARMRGFVTLTLVFSTTAIANWIVYTWLPLYLYEGFGMSLTAAGFTATFYIQAGSIGGILVGGRLADAWSRKSGSGRLYTQALGLSAAAPFLFLAGSTSAVGFLIAGLVVFGLGRGMFDCNAMPVLAQIARPDLRSTGYGIYNFVGCIVGGTMAALAGAIKGALGLTTAFQLAAAILFVSAVVLARLRLASQPADA
jgi:MFS transporter, Spinster family, sphingosine-1-phosphate transporter